jgi:TonB-dependent starch-binding outer membrane protein SusC
VSYKGRITDERTGAPVAGATISVKGAKINAVIGPDGSFTISAPSNAQLVVSYIGYSTVEVKAAAAIVK